jgi:hypothetical protein
MTETVLADGAALVDWEASMPIKNRKQFAYRIDMWDEDGANLVDHLAGVQDLDVAAATYRAVPTLAKSQDHVAPGRARSGKELVRSLANDATARPPAE